MVTFKSFHKSLNSSLINDALRLIDLIDTFMGLHIVTTDGERYYHLYIVLITEIG